MQLQFKTDRWQEFGPWLVLFIIPVVAFGFRRGYLSVLLCLLIINPDDAMAFEWNDLWLNKNQRAMRALENKQAETASELFQDNEWKAAARYRAGDYAGAEELLKDAEDIRSHYNKANALARQGRYKEAIAAYDQVLEARPDHEDAKFNKELIEKEMENQQNQQQQSRSKQDSESTENQQQSDSDQKDAQQSEQEPQQSEEQQSESDSQKPDEQKNKENPDQKQSDMKEEGERQPEQQQESKESQDETEEQPEQAQLSEQNMNELDEEQQASEQWLRRIPDDPSGLLRRKFKYQYQQQNKRPSSDGKYW